MGMTFFGGYREYIFAWLPQMAVASLVTLKLTVLALALAVAIGLLMALLRTSRSRLLGAVAVTYIEFFRGLPPVIVLFWVYYGLPETGSQWLVLNSTTSAVIALGAIGGAFLAEVFRSGIQALHKGQREAALSLGMTPIRALRWIILPQAFRIVLPPLANYAVGLLKDTSLCVIIAVPELLARAKELASGTFLPMQAYVLAAVFYYVMSFPMMRFVEYLEARMAAGK
jgi:His/Glu/Gln/Arg/opine family amino acid ABC transporter permease subunit